MSQENVLLHLNDIKPFSWENLLFKLLIYIVFFAIKLLILVFKFYQKVLSMTNKPVIAIEFQIHQIKL